MTLVVDAGPLVAAADRRDPWQRTIASILHGEPGQLVIPAPVTAEVEYMLGRRLGRSARLAFLEDLAVGRFAVAALDESDHRHILELEERYEDLDAGLSDLSMIVVAGRYSTTRLLTFDERHFRALRSVSGESFTLLPADATAA